MFKRNDNKLDAFHRQMGALRQQLGSNPEDPGDDQEDPHSSESESTADGDPQGSTRHGVAAAPAYPANPLLSYDDDVAADDEQEFVMEMSTSDVSSAPDPAGVTLADAQTSVVALDTNIKGDVVSEGTIHVHGRVEGTLTAKLDVFVAEEASVEATITAANVIIAGSVKGSIRCGARFEVLPQGRVDGEIQSPSLVVHEGAAIMGQFRMGAGEGTETVKAPVMQRRPTRGSA